MNNGKAKIDDSIGLFALIIPSKKNWFVLLFGTFWIGGWYIGFRTVLFEFGFDPKTEIETFMTFWLLGWTVAGLGIIVMLLWGYLGKEKLIIVGEEVKLEKTVFGIGLKKKLIKEEINDFRFEKINDAMFGGNRWAVWGMGPGKIVFDYGFKTYSFGLAVDDAEARYLVEELNKKI